MKTNETTGRFRFLLPDGQHLTATEYDVLRGLVEGLSYRQIAAQSGRPEKSIGASATHAYWKLAIENRYQVRGRLKELGVLESFLPPESTGCLARRLVAALKAQGKLPYSGGVLLLGKGANLHVSAILRVAELSDR